MDPIKTGFKYGLVAVVVAVVANFYFFFLSPNSTPEWITAVLIDFVPLLEAAAYLFLGILAAIRVRPETGIHEDASYRSQLLRDCTLAATVVAVLAGAGLLVVVALQATVFAEGVREYARQAAPQVIAYIQELGERFSAPEDPTTVAQIERVLQPPALADLGRSIFNLVLRALLLGVIGAIVGLLRGRFGARPDDSLSKPQTSEEAPQS